MNRHHQKRRAAIFQVLDLLHELPPIEPAESDEAEIEHLKAEIEANDTPRGGRTMLIYAAWLPPSWPDLSSRS